MNKGMYISWGGMVILLITINSVSAGVIGDTNGDGVVGIAEALYALQVSSGLHPDVPDNCLITGHGDWATGTAYNICDVVKFNGSFYICTQNHSSTELNQPPDENHWAILALKGDTGPQGPAGLSPNQLCPNNSYMIGLDANGDIICNSKYVFLSSNLYNGNLGGLSGADAKCQSLADAAGLPGEYKAWLSSSTESVSSRFTRANYPFRLVDGTEIAVNWDDLVDGNLLQPINKDEYGTIQVHFSRAWTNTRSNGTINNDSNLAFICNDWSSDLMSYYGYTGLFDSTTSDWTEQPSADSCNSMNRIYCFQQ